MTTTHIEYAISIANAAPRPEDHLDPAEFEHLVLGPGEALVYRHVTDWRPVS